MKPRTRRWVQRALLRLRSIEAEAGEIRHGDPAAQLLGSVGPGTRIEAPQLFLGNPSSVHFGANTYVRSGLRIEALAPPGGKIITVGDEGQFGYDIRLVAVNGIHIGNGVGIGHGATIADTIHEYKTGRRDEAPWKAPLKVGRPLTIEDHVWVGNNCVLTGGITIGKGSIINANSVISRDVPPHTIVSGNPPHIQKQLSDEGTWEWTIDPAELEL
ncbi:MAG TPA: acyltransferase [Acidimicrobiales bacterium]